MNKTINIILTSLICFLVGIAVGYALQLSTVWAYAISCVAVLCLYCSTWLLLDWNNAAVKTAWAILRWYLKVEHAVLIGNDYGGNPWAWTWIVAFPLVFGIYGAIICAAVSILIFVCGAPIFYMVRQKQSF